MRLEKKGFTLIELLTTIVILGLLVTLGYISVRSVLDRSDESYYRTQEDMLILAGREYFTDYRSELPKEIGETNYVTLKTLIDEKYIDPIKDKNENDCDNEKSRVIAEKITETKYQYYAILVCNDYETTKDEAKPVVKFTPNKKSSTKNIEVTMKLTDNEEVTSYRYVITKDGESYKDSGYLEYKGDVTIKLTEKGLYRITGYAKDSSGNTGSRTSGKYSIYVGIDCANVEFTNSTKINTWTNKNITVNIKLPNNTYRWELSRQVNGGNYEVINNYVGSVDDTYTITNEGRTKLRVVVYDKLGNSCTATTEGEYRVDKTAPTCVSSGGSNSWTNKNITLVGKCSDSGGSGCAGNVTRPYKSDTDATKQSPGTVRDNAGNTRACPANQTVKIDKTPPIITYTLTESGNANNRVSGGSNVASQRDITFSAGSSVLRQLSYIEKGSGFSYAQNYLSSRGWRTENNFASHLIESNLDASYRVVDKAGNVSNSVRLNVKIAGATFSGNTGNWVAVCNPRSCSQAGSYVPANGDGVCGNVVGRVLASWSNGSVTLNWELRNGNQTWVGVGYIVNLYIYKNGQAISATTLKPYSTRWYPSMSYSGSLTYALDPGTYDVVISSDTYSPTYNATLATMTIR